MNMFPSFSSSAILAYPAALNPRALSPYPFASAQSYFSCRRSKLLCWSQAGPALSCRLLVKTASANSSPFAAVLNVETPGGLILPASFGDID
jgi:hypothetical protein